MNLCRDLPDFPQEQTDRYEEGGQERSSSKEEPKRRGRPLKKDPPQPRTRPQRGRRSKGTQTDSNSPRKPRQLRSKKREDPLEVTPRRESHPGAVPTDSVPPKRIPVKDRWAYTSSSSDSSGDESPAPAHTPTRGQARYGLRRDRAKKDHQRGCPCCQYSHMVCGKIQDEISESSSVPSVERDFNDRKPGRGTSGDFSERF